MTVHGISGGKRRILTFNENYSYRSGGFEHKEISNDFDGGSGLGHARRGMRHGARGQGGIR
ncbi:hypothetical protein D3C85_1568680 [compost metagenome]